MSKLTKVSLLFLISFSTRNAFACQDHIYPEHISKKSYDTYETIIVMRVTKISKLSKDSWYAAPFKFQGEVVEELKGKYKKGDKINGETGGERPGAACPISLLENRVYLLFLRGAKNPVILPRYGTFFTESGTPNFKAYVDDLKKLRQVLY